MVFNLKYTDNVNTSPNMVAYLKATDGTIYLIETQRILKSIDGGATFGTIVDYTLSGNSAYYTDLLGGFVIGTSLYVFTRNASSYQISLSVYGGGTLFTTLFNFTGFFIGNVYINNGNAMFISRCEYGSASPNNSDTLYLFNSATLALTTLVVGQPKYSVSLATGTYKEIHACNFDATGTPCFVTLEHSSSNPGANPTLNFYKIVGGAPSFIYALSTSGLGGRPVCHNILNVGTNWYIFVGLISNNNVAIDIYPTDFSNRTRISTLQGVTASNGNNLYIGERDSDSVWYDGTDKIFVPVTSLANDSPSNYIPKQIYVFSISAANAAYPPSSGDISNLGASLIAYGATTQFNYIGSSTTDKIRSITLGKLFYVDGELLLNYGQYLLSNNPPPCLLAWGSPQFTTTNATSPTSNDGTITVNAAGQGTVQYQLDSGAFQNSNSFTGVAAGSHTLTIKDSSTCTPLTTNVYISVNDQPSGVLTIGGKTLNEYNFVRWYEAEGYQNFEGIKCSTEVWDYPRPYEIIRKKQKCFFYIQQLEDFSFYINFDVAITLDFSSLKLAVIDNHHKVNDVGALQQDLNTDGSYNLYCTLQLDGTYKEEIEYKFIIYNQYSGAVYFASNSFGVMTPDTALKYTCRLEHAHSQNIYNYYYARVPNYINQVRMRMNLASETSEANISNYRESSTGILRNVSFEEDKSIQFECYWWDIYAIRAMYEMQLCEYILINENAMVLKTVIKPTANTNGLNVFKAIVEFYEQKFSTANRYSGQPITIVGGDSVLQADNGQLIKI